MTCLHVLQVLCGEAAAGVCVHAYMRACARACLRARVCACTAARAGCLLCKAGTAAAKGRSICEPFCQVCLASALELHTVTNREALDGGMARGLLALHLRSVALAV